MYWLSRVACLLYLLGNSAGKWVEGSIDTKENWAFLSRFCFLSLNGQFEYLIEYDSEMGTPNLLLYYDDESQWPAVYHSFKSCKEREAVLNKNGQNQIIKLSHWYPDTEYSGCVITKANKQLPASKSSTTPQPVTKSTKTTTQSPNPTYYDQFLKTTKATDSYPKSTISSNSTNWYELLPNDEMNSTTELPEDELWENIGPDFNNTKFEKLKDVEILFDKDSGRNHKIKRSTNQLIQRYRRRRLNSESYQNGHSSSGKKERMVVTCHNSRRFRSARERWWFIAISNCDSPKGLEVKYKFLMTNGPDGDFWHEHFSADEFYVLPVLLSYVFAYVIIMIAIVICSVELKSRHLLHSTYKLFLISACAQHTGVLVQSLAYIKYAANGVGSEGAKATGQFFCGISEMTFLLMLVLLAKGYTVTRGRLKVGFTIKLTIFMCCYVVTYIVLFVYQAKEFDPGEVLYLYESPAGYGLIVLRITAWCVFAYSTFFTVRKYPEKNMFYCPFFICGTLWFYAGPLFILTANSYIDKWVRESVVTAVLLFITFSGHIMFLLLTLPVFANKNFPYHVRTTQIGVMEVTNSAGLDSFGRNAYHPSNGAAQTVIIPLTRRTEELIGNMYNQYMATAPPLSLENETPKLNGLTNRIDSISPKNGLISQDSTETNNSDEIKPSLSKEIFTVESQLSKMDDREEKLPNSGKNLTNGERILPNGERILPNGERILPNGERILSNGERILPNSSKSLPNGDSLVENDGRKLELPSLRARRGILEPIKREDPPVPTWSLAKGPCIVGMLKKKNFGEDEPDPISQNGRKVPPVKNGLQHSSGEISTIHEGKVQSYNNLPSEATVHLFTVGRNIERI